MGADTVLVVGAGFAGATYARELADAGYDVHVLDARDHVAGNAYDHVDANGVRVHKYGPHLFHTNNEAVVAWVHRFADWTPYQHRVRAVLSDGRHVPIPVNRETLEAVFDTKLASPTDAEKLLDSVRERGLEARNAAEYLYSKIGARLTNLFFRPYTKKMWGLDLEDLHAAIVKRIPLRFDSENRYFPDDRFQFLPTRGYHDLFRTILDHPRIQVILRTVFEAGMEKGYKHCFTSMPIDVFFDSVHGELPYRSIKFHDSAESEPSTRGWAVTNFTDEGPFTRETYWTALPNHGERPSPRNTVTREEPCDYRDNGFERYYPVKTADDRHAVTFAKYVEVAKNRPNVTFIGRCGTYQYLDMHQVINQSLLGAKAWLDRAGRGSREPRT